MVEEEGLRQQAEAQQWGAKEVVVLVRESQRAPPIESNGDLVLVRQVYLPMSAPPKESEML